MGKFRKGQSGNPAGRAPGSVNQSTRLRQAIGKDLPEIIESMVKAAKQGDTQAARLLLDRALPPLRGHAAPVELPELEAGESLTEKAEAVFSAVGAGRLPPDVGAQLLSAISGLARVAEVDELERRIAALEESG